MAMVRTLSLALAGSLLCAAQLSAQTGTISGRVIASTSRQPLTAVSIRLVGTQRGAVTRDDGTYTLPSVPLGAQRIRASRIGFSPAVRDVNVSSGSTVTAD